MKDYTHEIPLELNTSHWDMLLHLRDFGDREEYLRGIYFAEINQKHIDQNNEHDKFVKSKVRIVRRHI